MPQPPLPGLRWRPISMRAVRPAAGRSSLLHVRLAEPFCCVAVLCFAAAPAAAQDLAFDIPAGRLSDALVSLGEQAGISIGASDPNLATVRSRQVRGRMTVREALSR